MGVLLPTCWAHSCSKGFLFHCIIIIIIVCVGTEWRLPVLLSSFPKKFNVCGTVASSWRIPGQSVHARHTAIPCLLQIIWMPNNNNISTKFVTNNHHIKCKSTDLMLHTTTVCCMYNISVYIYSISFQEHGADSDFTFKIHFRNQRMMPKT